MANSNTPFEFFKKYQKDTLTFIYQGEFSDDITEDILKLSELRLEQTGSAKLGNKISFLIAECFQNVVRHADHPPIVNQTNNKPSHFMLRHTEDGYYVGSANLVDNGEVDRLKKHLENLNQMSAEELRALYLEVLANATFTERGGAGLGLIEMARKSKEAYDFHFEYINFYHTLFFILLRLKGGGQSDEGETEVRQVQLKELLRDYEDFYARQIQVLLHGDFSQSSILPLLDMVESNLSRYKEVGMRKRLFHILIEVLQNISKHSLEIDGGHPGIFLINRTKSGFCIEAGNYVSAEQAEELKGQWKDLEGKGEEELKELYKTKLRAPGPDKKGSAGLGLIDIARMCRGQYDIRFTPAAEEGGEEERQFYSIKITI